MTGAGHAGEISSFQEEQSFGWISLTGSRFHVGHVVVSKHGSDPMIESLLTVH